MPRLHRAPAFRYESILRLVLNRDLSIGSCSASLQTAMKRVANSFPLLVGIVLTALTTMSRADDQPQWGQAWSRNMVSTEKGLPDSFDPETGRNIKWSVPLGTRTHSTPIVGGGRIYIGTNNDEPRDPKHQGDRGVFMCFDERDGKLLWQLVVPKRHEDPYFDWPNTGISSVATVEGDRVYLVSNRGEVICLDAHGLADGNDGPFREEAAHMTPPHPNAAPARPVPGAEIRPEPLRPPADGVLLEPGALDADILWIFDMVSGAGIWPHDGAHGSILVHGDYLYLNTGTGVDNTHKRIRTPDAPSLIVLDKHTGKLVARDDERIAPNIFHATWCSPSLGEVNGRSLVFFGGGNGIVYSFETLQPNSQFNEVQKLKKVWQFDFDPTAPKEDAHRYNGNRREGPSNIWWGKNEAWLKCIDPTKTGGITPSGLVWTYPLQRHVMSTVAIQDGLLFIADCGRKFHCVDAESGKPYWTHDIQGDVWASPLVADGKVYLGTRSGHFYVFAASQEKQVLSSLALITPISSTATAANGVLYFATMNRLLAGERTGE